MVRAFITSLLLCACAAGGPMDGYVTAPLVEPVEVTPHVVPVFLFTVLGDDPEVVNAAHQAAQRWEQVTGWKIRIVDDGGIAIRVWPRLFAQMSDDGNYSQLAEAPNAPGEWRSLCGNTFLDEERYGIDVSTGGSCTVLYTITHEMGHVLRGYGGHSETGLMASGDDADRSDVIDLASWDLVCVRPCDGEPEQL